MKSRLTPAQQIERFGMSHADACTLRDRVGAALTPALMAEARAAWQALAYDLRGNKGQPMQSKRHPEAIRFQMLVALDAGKSVADAVAAAREYAES